MVFRSRREGLSWDLETPVRLSQHLVTTEAKFRPRGGAMPLSEHEQRLLEQMERQLYADDPKLASTLRGTGRSLRSRHQVVLGAIGIVLGLVLLVAGVAAPLWPLGVAGFLVMLGSGWWASSGWHSEDSSFGRSVA